MSPELAPEVGPVVVPRAEVAKRVMIAIGLILNLVVLSIVVWMVVLIRDQQVTNTSTSTSTNTLVHIIHDCLDPHGVCYQRGQANQQEILAQVGTLFTYAQLCGNDQTIAHNLPALERCVGDLIKEHGLG
jgi:phosphoribulokinase